MSKIEVNTIDVQSGSTLTLGSSGKTVTLAACASQSGFGRTGTVNWCTTAKTSPLTAVSGKGYFINTSGGAVTVTLPSSPSAGDIVSIKDYASTFSSNNVTVGRGGSKMGSECLDATLSTDGDSITLVYVDGTQGWLNIQTDDTVQGARYVAATGGTITTCGNFKIHTFTSSGCFQVTSAGNAAGTNTIEYMVVGGGGGGGGTAAGGGGGAGGYRESSGSTAGCYSVSPLGGCVSALAASVATFPITIGAGGSGGSGAVGSSGSVSTFSSISSAGGGGGANFSTNPAGTGGSGGGGGGRPPCASATGAAGNTPPVSPPQGNPGGNTNPSTSNPDRGGGGGGATAAGTTPSGNSSGPGGAGATSSINGTPTVRAGGGGGGKDEDSPNGDTSGDGGSGGGGRGASSDQANSRAGATGTANTGGGGGGAGAGGPAPYTSGYAGGSGIVILRYKFQQVKYDKYN